MLVPAGWAVVGVAALLMLTFRADGLIVGMGSKASTAAVLAAAGLTLAGVGASNRPDADQPQRSTA
ncbi:MAG: hypothetical protein IPO44_07560 [Candidatus Microthrix sp.]|nr:hypothetical protein [Candidatus Microthrix sp.]MBK9559402.1 hypothetical protein [Candidatus Microthrix sp.]